MNFFYKIFSKLFYELFYVLVYELFYELFFECFSDLFYELFLDFLTPPIIGDVRLYAFEGGGSNKSSGTNRSKSGSISSSSFLK